MLLARKTNKQTLHIHILTGIGALGASGSSGASGASGTSGASGASGWGQLGGNQLGLDNRDRQTEDKRLRKMEG